jgi:hypothetical protein
MLKHDSPLGGASCGSDNGSLAPASEVAGEHTILKLAEHTILKLAYHALLKWEGMYSDPATPEAGARRPEWLTLSDPQLAPPSGELCFSMNNYMFIDRTCFNSLNQPEKFSF